MIGDVVGRGRLVVGISASDTWAGRHAGQIDDVQAPRAAGILPLDFLVRLYDSSTSRLFVFIDILALFRRNQVEKSRVES